MNAPFPATISRELRSSDIPQGNVFARMLTARVIASVHRMTPSGVAAMMWPHDRVTAELLERAVSAPAMTSVAGWAAELAQRKIVDTLAALYQYSASARLFALGTVLSFDGAAAISVPGFVASFGNKGFIAEGTPIPVQQLALTIPDQLKPTKCAGVVVLTREMVESSNAEALITDAAFRMLGRMVDEALFDANPSAADRPRGLRQGVAALTPSSIAGDAWSSALSDMGKLADAVAPVSGPGPLAFIGSPGRALKANAYLNDPDDEADTQVFGSGAVINDYLCVAVASLIAALGDPTVESSTSSTLHMNDVPVADVGTVGRHASMWQTDSVAIKLRMPVSWAVRDPRGFAWMTPTGW